MKKLILFISSFLFAITPIQYQKKLGLGIDVNWATFNKYIKNKYYKQAFIFKKLGFNSVRIRFKNPNATKLSKKQYYKLLKHCVDISLQNNLIPILTFTSKTLDKNPSIEKINTNVKIWGDIAKIFANYPNSVSYDLFIEPSKGFNKKPQLLIQFYNKSIQAIRKIDKKKIIFIAPNHASNPYYLDILNPIIAKNYKNIMIEWHYYAAGASKHSKNKQWTTGTTYEKELISKKTTYAYKWCNKRNLFSWVGAIMPGNYNKGDTYSYVQQKLFMKTIIDNLHKYSIPFAINADGQFYNYKTKKLKRKEVLNFITSYYLSIYK